MLRRSIAVLAAALLLACELAGCGDDALSANDLRTQATQICTRTTAETDRIAVPRSADESARFLHAGAATMGPALARLRALKPPKEMRASYAQAVSVSGQELALITAQAKAIDGGADAIVGFRRLQAALIPLMRIEDATWRALEIPACVQR
jgi:hypothetical protein